MKEISKRIFELLSKQGKTQKDLASQIGIKQNAIAQWKIDNTNPKAEYLPIIAHYFNVTADYLLGLTDCPTTSAMPDGWERLSNTQREIIMKSAKEQIENFLNK